MSKEESFLDNMAFEDVNYGIDPKNFTPVAEEALRSPPSDGSERLGSVDMKPRYAGEDWMVYGLNASDGGERLGPNVMRVQGPWPLKFRPRSDITTIEVAWLAHFFASLSALGAAEKHEAWSIIQRHFEEVGDG